MDDHGVSLLGYALIACGALLVGASHGLLAITLRRRRGGARDGSGKEVVAVATADAAVVAEAALQ